MRSAQKFAGNNQNWQSDVMNRVKDDGLAALASANPMGEKQNNRRLQEY